MEIDIRFLHVDDFVWVRKTFIEESDSQFTENGSFILILGGQPVQDAFDLCPGQAVAAFRTMYVNIDSLQLRIVVGTTDKFMVSDIEQENLLVAGNICFI